MLIRRGNIGLDGGPELLRTSMPAAPELFLGQQGEPPFDEIQPRGAGRGEVGMEPRPLEQPPPDQRGLMRSVVVHDQMHVEVRRHVRVNGVEELPEFSGALALVELAHHLPGLDVQSRKQGGGAMAAIVVGAPLNLPGTHRQQGLRPVQRLNLRLLVHAQHQGFVGRIQIEADNVPDLLNEEGILRKFERLGPMRLQSEGPPDAADRALAEPTGLRHRARTPVRCVTRHGLQGAGHHPLDIRVHDRAGSPGPRLIEQAVEPLGQKARPPFAHRWPGHPQAGRHGHIRLPVRTGQDEARTLRQRLGGPWAPGPLLERGTFRHGQCQRRERASESHRDPPFGGTVAETDHLVNAFLTHDTSRLLKNYSEPTR